MVSGDIRSSDYAEIKRTANIAGNILTKSIRVEFGAIINGSIHIDREIDERELIEMVESRLEFKNQVKTSTAPYLIVEQPDLDINPQNELSSESLPIKESLAELNSRTVIPSANTKSSKQADLDDQRNKSTNRWY